MLLGPEASRLQSLASLRDLGKSGACVRLMPPKSSIAPKREFRNTNWGRAAWISWNSAMCAESSACRWSMSCGCSTPQWRRWMALRRRGRVCADSPESRVRLIGPTRRFEGGTEVGSIDAGHGFHSWSGTYRARPLFGEVTQQCQSSGGSQRGGRSVSAYAGDTRVSLSWWAPLSGFRLPTTPFRANCPNSARHATSVNAGRPGRTHPCC